MLDDELTTTSTTTAGEEAGSAPESAPAARKAAAKKAPAKKTAAKKTTSAKTTAKKTATKKTAESKPDAVEVESATESAESAADKPAKKAAPKKRASAKPSQAKAETTETTDADKAEAKSATKKQSPSATALLFQAPEVTATQRTRQPQRAAGAATAATAAKYEEAPSEDVDEAAEAAEAAEEGDDAETEAEQAARRRRRRGGRRRRKPGTGEAGDSDEDTEDSEDTDDTEGGGVEPDASEGESGAGAGTRRRRVRVRDGESGAQASGDPNTVTRVRKGRSPEDEITSVQGSTRLEAKKQRRREGREAGRRRAPIVSEAEFLARRESVERVMAIRQRDDLIQIAVLEDKVLVEHYVARESQTSLIGNVYLGRVQNVLPSMEAAFIDIGKGRNAVLYAGEVNWSALGHKDGQPRKIESVLTSGQSVLVQVTKDPVGHKGARLTSQVSLAGRFLVYVPDGTTSGISRKLPDTERNRLKNLLKEIVPDTAGVIVRTAAEGASEEELTRDVERLKARWEDIEKGSKSGSAPKLLYGEPDLTLKVVRDLFTEDFSKLVIQGADAWDTVQGYVAHVAPDLEERLERFEPGDNGADIFAAYRIDEQIAKGLDRKVWLPSGGSLIIDRTEAMTVVDVNTGKFTGSGGNLEETVTKNNLEAAEEIVRQLRLRDIGGIIVVDFIDMVLESNRDLVLRRLVECLGRDRTRHQVAEVTSLGLVQMTRKRIGTGLLEAFSENCEHCAGRGVLIHDMPVEARKSDDSGDRRGGGRRSRGRGGATGGTAPAKAATPTPKDVAAVARPENAEKAALDEDAPPVEDAPSVEETPLVEEVAQRPSRDQEPEEAPSVEEVAEAPLVEEVAQQPSRDQEPEPEPEPAQAEAPVEAGTTKVVTRTRRAASRPAGTAASLEPVAIVVPESSAASAAEDVPAAEPPKVVTRTRRAVSRPAGAAGAPEPVTVGAPSEGQHGDEDDHPHLELHVPIKKKGSRKR